MCGIFGVLIGEDAGVRNAVFRSTVDRLFVLSESRGKESAGLAISNGGPIQVYKQPVAASEMIRSTRYKELLSMACVGGPTPSRAPMRHPVALIGHSRLVTNGVQENNLNNQPVIAGDMVGIHNGIIVNDRELWSRCPTLRRTCDVDTEVLLSLIRSFHREGQPLFRAVRSAFAAIQGAASVAILFRDFDHLLLATNNGALYLCARPEAQVCVFASEAYILQTLLSKHRTLQRLLAGCEISQCRPGYAGFVRLSDASVAEFSLLGDAAISDTTVAPRGSPKDIVDLSATERQLVRTRPSTNYRFAIHADSDDVDLLFHGKESIQDLSRCTRCVLPETFPYIRFDENGVCSYCRTHKKYDFLGRDALERQVAPIRRGDGRPDCLVGISGGRDSCYGLHYIKSELGLNAIAYTYDWGMVTDLARRNISRMCGKLGIEHILVSANILRKRRFIKNNVTAWLKRPDLGMVPLFMAGDKQFFYYANKLKKQTGIQKFIFCAGNRFEQTFFKTGFCRVGASPGGILTSLSLWSKLKLAGYYAKQAIVNPRYLNSSIIDTLFAYFSSYMMSHDYVYLYHYIPMIERDVLKLLRDEYDWELAQDTVATWRIGDGSAAFYNYIYYTVAGFSEFDTFRSNQIREGVIDRAEALNIVNRENKPRYESIKWYLGVIDMDIPFNDVIKTINAIPKLYRDAGTA